MANKAKKFSVQSYDNKHYRMTEQYTRAVDRLFDTATTSIAEAAANGKYDPGKPFSFDDHPKVRTAMREVTGQLASRLQVTIETGSRAEWLAACDKNDAFLNSIMDTSELCKSTLSKMTDQNLDALAAFQKRKVDGMDLSARVWNYVGQYRDQMEQALDVGLGEGRSAQQLARDVMKNLKEPNRLFRRVRDKRGNLVLSKNARAFHPGRGVYRSSVKNAQRLTRSEINMAYRTSDYERWQRLDFIVGFEIQRSNHQPLCKCSLCEQLVGKYPKEFRFVGWHPQCMCYAIPVMMDEETIDENEAGDLKAALFGTTYKHKAGRNGITDVPQGFRDWMKENAPKQKNWASSPYFVRDNFKNGTIADGLSITPSPSPIAKVQPVKVDPKEQELNALAPQIEEIRQLCQEWGITTAWIDRAVADKNIEEIREAIAVLRRDIDDSRGLFSQYDKSAKKAIAQAKARGVDASAVEADLQAVHANHKLWKANAPSYQQRLSDLQKATPQDLRKLIEEAEKNGVDYLEVKDLPKNLTTEEIVEKVGGPDQTGGSCASAALAYAGNKAGLDVLDFRGGKSKDYFCWSNRWKEMADELGGMIEEHTNDYTASSHLLDMAEQGKEYILVTGKHAAVVRKVGKDFEYLELQDSASRNGWRSLTLTSLQQRFGCSRSHTVKYVGKVRVNSMLIDIEQFAKNTGFRRLLGYLNTKESAQHKGAGGGIK